MNDQTLQLVAVLAIVAAAVIFVLRRAWRKHQGQAPACGNCSNCHSAAVRPCPGAETPTAGTPNSAPPGV